MIYHVRTIIEKKNKRHSLYTEIKYFLLFKEDQHQHNLILTRRINTQNEFKN